MEKRTQQGKLTNLEIASFCSEMAMILKSGISSLEGVDLLREDAQTKAEKKLLDEIYQSVMDTGRLDQGLGETKVFPEYLIRMTQIGEETGTLDEVMESLAEHYDRYPHDLSGGQRQRLNLARALICEPRLVVCDEPVSALDVSVQAQVLNLLRDLQRTTGVALLFITHDMRVVRHMSDRIGVLYHGRLVEEGAAEDVIAHPSDPYTQELIDAIP